MQLAHATKAQPCSNGDKRSGSVVLFKEIERRYANTRGIQAATKNGEQDVRLTVC